MRIDCAARWSRHRTRGGEPVRLIASNRALSVGFPATGCLSRDGPVHDRRSHYSHHRFEVTQEAK
jgi:hypothetical protein